MTHPLYTPSTARSPKVISFEPLQRGADAAEADRSAENQLVAAMKADEARAAPCAKRDQLIEEQLRASPVRTPGERGGGVTVSKNPPLTEDQIRSHL